MTLYDLWDEPEKAARELDGLDEWDADEPGATPEPLDEDGD